MNIKLKKLFKYCLISSLVLVSCDENDLEDSGLELNIKPYNLENLNGGKSFKFEIDGNADLVTGLVIKNKIAPKEGEQSVFIVSETIKISENEVKDKIIRVFSSIENVREFNFDVGRKTQFKIWSLRYTGGIQNLPGEVDAEVSSDFFVNAITGSNFGITEFGDAILVNLIDPIP